MNKRAISSLSFVLMLVISTFAFAFLIGSEVKTVSAISWNPTTWGKTFSEGDSFSYSGNVYVYVESSKKWETARGEPLNSVPIRAKVTYVNAPVATNEEIKIINKEVEPEKKAPVETEGPIVFPGDDAQIAARRGDTKLVNGVEYTYLSAASNGEGWYSNNMEKLQEAIAVPASVPPINLDAKAVALAASQIPGPVGITIGGNPIAAQLPAGVYSGNYIANDVIKSGTSTLVEKGGSFTVGLNSGVDAKYKPYIVGGVSVTSEQATSILGASTAGVFSKGVPAGSTYDSASKLWIAPTGARYGSDGKVVDRGTYDSKIFGKDTSFATGQIVDGFQWSLIALGAVQTLAPVLGVDKDETNAISIAAMSGIMAGKLAYSFLGRGGTTYGSSWIASEKGAIGSKSLFGFGGQGQTARFISSPGFSVGLGLATAWLMYNSMHKKEKESREAVTFSCLPWQAPNGGSDCELCNDKTGLPCSEYRCKSLGQSCELQNIGTTREMCVDANRRDASPPTIKPDYTALTPSFSYSDVKDMPPGAGFKITSNATNTGCIKPFTPLEFGITTNEPSQCRIDVEPKGSYDAMSAYFGGDSLYSYNHTESLSLPSTVDIKNSSLELANGKELSFFIRCKDAVGNINEADYELKLCVDPSPDTTAPVIEGTSILNNGCISADSDNATVDFYTNEPSECKWSFTANQDFNQMQNNMTCLNSIREINALQVYTCSSSLTGVARDGTNFYVKCKDQPALGNDTKRNPNREDYVFSLRGSNKLKLNTIQPNETVYGAVRPTAVELYAQTTYGCDSNQAYCYYSATGDEGSFVQFFDTNKGDGIHTQRLDLLEGDYTYYVRCVDSGGNLVENTTSFKVDIDTNAPIITRVYQKDDLLKVETQRSSECVFTNDNCDYLFVEGTEMPYTNQPVHVTQWMTDKTYYIKCRDEFRTEPTDCSMIVRPTANFL